MYKKVMAVFVDKIKANTAIATSFTRLPKRLATPVCVHAPMSVYPRPWIERNH